MSYGVQHDVSDSLEVDCEGKPFLAQLEKVQIVDSRNPYFLYETYTKKTKEDEKLAVDHAEEVFHSNISTDAPPASMFASKYNSLNPKKLFFGDCPCGESKSIIFCDRAPHHQKPILPEMLIFDLQTIRKEKFCLFYDRDRNNEVANPRNLTPLYETLGLLSSLTTGVSEKVYNIFMLDLKNAKSTIEEFIKWRNKNEMAIAGVYAELLATNMAFEGECGNQEESKVNHLFGCIWKLLCDCTSLQSLGLALRSFTCVNDKQIFKHHMCGPVFFTRLYIQSSETLRRNLGWHPTEWESTMKAYYNVLVKGLIKLENVPVNPGCMKALDTKGSYIDLDAYSQKGSTSTKNRSASAMFDVA
jgi:hypothetical protein